MLKELYNAVPSFPDDRFVTNTPLSKIAIETLKDPICQNIPNIFCRDSPAECKSCSQIYCSRCIEMILKNDSKCPKCNEYLTVRKVNRYLKVIISRLSMHCHFEIHGCTEALPFELMIDHESKCEFGTTECPNQCGKQIVKKSIEKHLKFDCAKAITKCKYTQCQIQLPREQLYQHERICEYHVEPGEQQVDSYIESLMAKDHEKTREQTAAMQLPAENPINGPSHQLLRCSNSGCYFTTTQNDIKAHEEVCSYKAFNCKNAKRGCGYRGTKFDLLGHESRCEYGLYSLQRDSGRKKKIFSQGENMEVNINGLKLADFSLKVEDEVKPEKSQKVNRMDLEPRLINDRIDYLDRKDQYPLSPLQNLVYDRGHY